MQPVSFDVHPSKILLFLLIFIHAGTIICCWYTAPLVIASFIWHCKKQLKSRKIEWDKVNLNQPMICTPWFVLVRPFVIFPDAMTKHDFRRLRVYLLNGIKLS